MDLTNTTIEINTIIWAPTKEKAKEIAGKYSQGNIYCDCFYISNEEEFKNQKTYIRSPDEMALLAPQDITHVLILYVSSAESDDFAAARKYLDSRKGIPIKILCSENALFDQAAEMDCKFINVSEIIGEGKVAIIKEAKRFEETLLKCFNKFDINNNGVISVDELIKVSEELGHNLQFDDAKMIADSLDENKSGSGEISYSGFKKWWVLGKSDFHSFRRLCKAEMSVNNLVKLTSKKFNSYLENLKSDSQKVSQEEILTQLNLNLHSKQNFENGVGIFVELVSGGDAKDAISSYQDRLKKSPLAFSSKIGFSDSLTANSICELLNQMVKPMVAEIPQIAPFLSMGLEYEFRTSNNFVIIDVWVEGYLSDMIISQSQQFNIQNIDMSGDLTLHYFNALTLKSLFDQTKAFEIVEKITNSKFHLHSKSFGLRQMVTSFLDQYSQTLNNIPEMMENEKKKALLIFKSLFILRGLNFDFAFDAADLKDLLLNIMTTERKKYQESFEECKERMLNGDSEFDVPLRTIREHYEEGKAKVNEMKSSIPEEFITIIKSVDLEKIVFEFLFNINSSCLILKTNICLPGLNEIRDELIG